jgi:MoaA/NifB/PqqE/SkfB family radical SAM enzyme
MTSNSSAKNQTKIAVRGLDHYSKDEIEKFWKEWSPENPKIRAIGLSTPKICNLRCIYCYAGSDRVRSKNELTLDEYKRIVDEAREIGAEVALICGDGEPLMYKYLVELVQHIAEREMYPVVVTNGIALGDDHLSKKVHGMDSFRLCETLYDCEASLVVKMDSITKEIYEKIVGVPGTFDKFMNAVENIQNVGFNRIIGEVDGKKITRLAFSAVVMTLNIHEVRKMKEFARKMNAQFICKLPSLVGEAVKHSEVMFSPEDYEIIRETLLNKISDKRETLLADGMRCMAWHYGIVIDDCGEVRECYTSPCTPENRVGNIRERSLKELLRIRCQKFDILMNDVCPVKKRLNEEWMKRKGRPFYKLKESDILKL